jgi:AmmeMemoRadiSam system protein B
MCAAIKAQVASGRKVTILAGVDLAHVGPRFGDQLELNDELLKRIETEDRASIEHALKLDADKFYASVIADGHWRKVCGLSAIYTAVRLMNIVSDGKAEGRFLTYGQAPDPLGGIVSFTSLIYPA